MVLSITAGIIALWKGLPLAGKVIVGISGAYVAHRLYQAAADWVNAYLDENHPNISFRLNATIVRWGTELVKSVISVAVANDRTGEVQQRLKNLSFQGGIDLMAHIIGQQFDEMFGRSGSEVECEIVAHGVHYALAHA